MQMCQKLQFLKWPLEADSTSESIPVRPHNKMPNFIAEINMFTAWLKKEIGTIQGAHECTFNILILLKGSCSRLL